MSMQERARLVGAEFQLQSAPGHGTIIRVSAPYEERKGTRRPRVVIVDDHETMRSMLRRYIESDCAIVGEAANGREAIEVVEQHRPDIVLLDVSMRVMNGFEAARMLRERLPETRIIFASQHAESTYVEEAFRVGASGYLLKKAAAAELPEAVRTVFAGGVFRPPEIM